MASRVDCTLHGDCRSNHLVILDGISSAFEHNVGEYGNGHVPGNHVDYGSCVEAVDD